MTKNQLDEGYFSWLCDLVFDRHHKHTRYSSLLYHLSTIPFVWVVEGDENRAADGFDLRNRYLDTTHSKRLDCESSVTSVLEVIVALAVRMEEQILNDSEYGDRTSQWFWVMMGSLKLLGVTNNHFNPTYIDSQIDCFMNRYYDENIVTLFPYVDDKVLDMEIWYQAYDFINRNI